MRASPRSTRARTASRRSTSCSASCRSRAATAVAQRDRRHPRGRGRRRRARRRRASARRPQRLARGRRRAEECDRASCCERARARSRLGARGRVAVSAAVRPRARRRVPRQSGARRARRSAARRRDSAARARRPRSLLRRKTGDRRAGTGARHRVPAALALEVSRGRSWRTAHDRSGHRAHRATARSIRAALARPQKKNALTGAMYEALIEAFETAERDEGVGAFLLSGKGGVFTAGNDIGDFLAAASARERATFRPGGSPSRSPSSSKPLVAAVEGSAVGIGTTLCLHCDLVYADAECALPDAVRQSWPRAGGRLVAARAAALRPRQGGRIPAARRAVRRRGARALGLVNAIVPPNRTARPRDRQGRERSRPSRARRCSRPAA